MGSRSDGKPITHYARSWAQMQAARKRPQYNVIKTGRNWKTERFHADGTITPLGTFSSKAAAVGNARLLAGRTGDVTVKDYEG